jgi:hypothetical protein
VVDGFEPPFRGRSPIRKHDDEFMGIEKEKILDFSPIGKVR